MVSSRGPWRWLRWVIAAVAVIVVLAGGGPFVHPSVTRSSTGGSWT